MKKKTVNKTISPEGKLAAKLRGKLEGGHRPSQGYRTADTKGSMRKLHSGCEGTWGAQRLSRKRRTSREDIARAPQSAHGDLYGGGGSSR